ncbi:MAG: DUF4157 domain-containing protein [Pyrinomonadaceae bacterium]
MSSSVRTEAKPSITPVESGAQASHGLLQNKCACGKSHSVGGACGQCRDKKQILHQPNRQDEMNAQERGSQDGPELLDSSSGQFNSLFTDSRFSHDFSRVRVQNSAPPATQPKLRIGQPGDRYEQEADRVASEIMRMPDTGAPQFSGVAHQGVGASTVQRACAACSEKEDEDKVIQAKKVAGEMPALQPSAAESIHAMQRGGEPLNARARSFFEPRFGYDFSHVRVHTDTRAADVARSINARAFTTGNSIVFGAGQYDPSSAKGKELLAHELTHVVQQVPHIARADGDDKPPCFSGHAEGQGENMNMTFYGVTYKYRIWGTWKAGDSTSAFRQRAFEKWLAWRFGSLPATARSKMLEYAAGLGFVDFSTVAVTGCQYNIPMELAVYSKFRTLSGEPEREAAAAKKKKEEEAKKAEEEKAAGGGGEAAEGEPPAGETKTAPPPQEGAQEGGTGEPPADQKKTPTGPPPDPQQEKAAKSGGIGTINSATEESKAHDTEAASPLKKDWGALTDADLAKNYLSLLEHFAGLTVAEKDKTAAADGLNQEELDGIVDDDHYLQLLTSLYTQGYSEFKSAKGSEKAPFFKLEEVIFEQVVRGNPTATHNNLKIGYSTVFEAEKNILGIVYRGDGELYYDADGLPLPGISGVGFRDKGYIGAKQPEEWGINIAKVKEIDEGLFILLNSLRQTFSDPMRMSVQGAEVYFNNVEIVNAKVRQGLSAVIWQKFEEMLPYFVGFIAGHLLAKFLMKVPNPTVAAVGLALQTLLTAAGYLMQIDLAESALSRLKDVAWHLSRVEVDDEGKIKADTISQEHVEKAAVPLRDLVADIALIAATAALGKLLRAAQSGKAKCELGCASPCEVTETGKGSTPEAATPEVKPGETPVVEPPKAGEVPKSSATPEVKPATPEATPAAPKRTPIPGDADYTGPQPPKSWRLTDEGMGAHMVERQNVPSRPGMSAYDQPQTPRFYPEGGPENAGQAHIRMHQATKGAGIKGRGGNPGVAEADLIGKYKAAYADPICDGIKGDLRTPDGSKVIAKDVTVLEAFEALVKWGDAQKAAATPTTGTPTPTPTPTPTTP